MLSDCLPRKRLKTLSSTLIDRIRFYLSRCSYDSLLRSSFRRFVLDRVHDRVRRQSAVSSVRAIPRTGLIK